MNVYQEYENIFSSWLDEDIIEEIPESEIQNYGKYLSHHPVIKPSSSTTPMLPVFDPSARLPNQPSYQCLHCGLT
ncbi:integrase catalytic domain-containing protein [Nephila pilipes]|uniref:Integrase catalytic domain-containing protein n=1 Tax=Nephila pilipes TaxID=299642 RepID=A0A8X6MBB2_NEPPI|nr:integrase catalytic domain-containing protein [Nephila pilipes]